MTSVELASTLLAQDQQKNMFVHAVILGTKFIAKVGKA